MRTSVKTTNVELNDALSRYLDEKLAHVEKFMPSGDESVHAEVEIGKTTEHHKHGDVYRAEINLHIARKNFRAVAHGEDLYAAIDEMQDEIVREVKRYTKRKRVLQKRGGRSIKNLLRFGRKG